MLELRGLVISLPLLRAGLAAGDVRVIGLVLARHDCGCLSYERRGRDAVQNGGKKRNSLGEISLMNTVTLR